MQSNITSPSSPAENDSAATVAPALYLLPVTMSDEAPDRVLPAYNLHLLNNIRCFVVENVRTARRFLKRVNRLIDINSLSFVELSEHTPDADIPPMLDPLAQGSPVGVMSEAGCPAVADPGARLVEVAQRRGFKVIPLVGPSSILLALMASGMNGQNFTFNGYLPIDDRNRDARLRELANIINRHDTTQIFIETPYRNNRLIGRLCSVLPGSLRLCIASDITGPRESIITRSLADWKNTTCDYDKTPTIFVLGR